MKFLRGFLELLFPTPRICPFCHTRQGELMVCSHCLEELQLYKEQEGQCQRCGTFGVRGRECSNCFYWPQYFTGNYAAIPYAGQWKKTIHRLKFKGQGWLAPPLARLMVHPLEKTAYDLVIPVPLHRERLQLRGFNQATLLGQQLAKEREWPFNDQLLQRVIATPYQSGLSQRKRRANVQQAFLVQDPSQILRGKNILLVDDLFTSGATLLECAKTLHGAGAKQVRAITLGAGIN